jgi:hypothetical protein
MMRIEILVTGDANIDLLLGLTELLANQHLSALVQTRSLEPERQVTMMPQQVVLLETHFVSCVQAQGAQTEKPALKMLFNMGQILEYRVVQPTILAIQTTEGVI